METRSGVISDGAENLRALFSAASPGAVVRIPEGRYLVDTDMPIVLPSSVRVEAAGAVFLFPRDLGKARRREMFVGEDLCSFSWHGGHFVGYVFDPDAGENAWEPADYSGCIRVSGENCRDLYFEDITAENIAGAVIHVCGTREKNAENIDIRNCRFTNCGKFMWDYGYLWQNAVFPEAATEAAVKNAFRYLPEEMMSSPLSVKDGRLWAEKMPRALPEERDAVTFFGAEMPAGIKRGRQYFVCNKGAENGLFLSETEGGTPIPLTDVAPGLRLFRNMFYLFHDLFDPIGDVGHVKGSIDVTHGKNVILSGCRFGASGDSMHILECENVVFTGNQITAARMGAFYIGFFCRNVTVSGNTVYGTNGSRTVSVERSSRDVVITGNAFIGGGRGAWFNQPQNIVVSDNLFLRNTGKCTPDFAVGRVSQATGDFEKYPEVYFTRWEENGTYGPVVLRGNIIETGPGASAAISFHPGGREILVADNIIRGENREVHVAAGCEAPLFRDNIGMGEVRDVLFVNTANVR